MVVSVNSKSIIVVAEDKLKGVWALIKRLIILFVLLAVPGAWAEVGAEDFRAVSLRVLQDKFKMLHGKKGYSEELLRFAGLTEVDGYIVDEANADLVFFGKKEPGLPLLYSDDFVVALRNTWLKYAVLKGNTYDYRAPYCSIEPDLQAVESLKNIGNQIREGSDAHSVERAVKKWRELCRAPQSVRILGIPFDSHFASVLVKADYDMKKLAIGSDSVSISGFTSLSDMTLEKARSDFVEEGSVSISSSIGNRFWFHPGEILFLEHEGIITIEKCQVVLLTEESYLRKGGKISGEGKTSEVAESFAENFTSLYGELTKQKPIYIEFENLFNILALSKSIKFKSSHEKAAMDLGYLMDRYPLSRTSVSKHLPGESNVKRFEEDFQKGGDHQIAKVWIPFCGGVAMNIKLSDSNFKWDRSGKLSQMRRKISESRPGPDALFWNFRHW